MSEHPVDELDQYEFDDKAAMAASMLAGHGHAFVDLQPGDATTYKIVVVQPLIAFRLSDTGWMLYPDTYWVGTSFGPLYQWHPHNSGHTSWDYVLSKWVAGNGGTAEWTARVIARFLNTLRDRMKEER